MYRANVIYLTIAIICCNYLLIRCVTHGDRLCADETCEGIISFGQAKESYKSANDVILSFVAGDTVSIISKNLANQDGLWFGEIKGTRGFFPSQLVEESRFLSDTLYHISADGKLIKRVHSPKAKARQQSSEVEDETEVFDDGENPTDEEDDPTEISDDVHVPDFNAGTIVHGDPEEPVSTGKANRVPSEAVKNFESRYENEKKPVQDATVKTEERDVQSENASVLAGGSSDKSQENTGPNEDLEQLLKEHQAIEGGVGRPSSHPSPTETILDKHVPRGDEMARDVSMPEGKVDPITKAETLPSGSVPAELSDKIVDRTQSSGSVPAELSDKIVDKTESLEMKQTETKQMIQSVVMGEQVSEEILPSETVLIKDGMTVIDGTTLFDLPDIPFDEKPTSDKSDSWPEIQPTATVDVLPTAVDKDIVLTTGQAEVLPNPVEIDDLPTRAKTEDTQASSVSSSPDDVDPDLEETEEEKEAIKRRRQYVKQEDIKLLWPSKMVEETAESMITNDNDSNPVDDGIQSSIHSLPHLADDASIYDTEFASRKPLEAIPDENEEKLHEELKHLSNEIEPPSVVDDKQSDYFESSDVMGDANVEATTQYSEPDVDTPFGDYIPYAEVTPPLVVAEDLLTQDEVSEGDEHLTGKMSDGTETANEDAAQKKPSGSWLGTLSVVLYPLDSLLMVIVNLMPSSIQHFLAHEPLMGLAPHRALLAALVSLVTLVVSSYFCIGGKSGDSKATLRRLRELEKRLQEVTDEKARLEAASTNSATSNHTSVELEILRNQLRQSKTKKKKVPTATLR